MNVKLANTDYRLFVCLALVAAVGCQTGGERKWKFADAFSMEQGMPWQEEDEVVRGTPNRLTATWTDVVLHAPGRNPERGFGGKVMFFDGKSPSPIAVEGDLVVYAFDETDRKSYDNQPNKRYVFPQPELDKMMKVTEIGPAYNVWLPWDVVGGHEKQISLICRFQPREGPFFASDQASLTLPGRLIATQSPQDPGRQAAGGVVPATQDEPATGGWGQRASQASYESSAPAGGWNEAGTAPSESQANSTASEQEAPRRGLRTTTIKLPSKRR